MLTATVGNDDAAKWEADEIRALEPAFSVRKWLESYPMTSASHQQRLISLLAKVNL